MREKQGRHSSTGYTQYIQTHRLRRAPPWFSNTVPTNRMKHTESERWWEPQLSMAAASEMTGEQIYSGAGHVRKLQMGCFSAQLQWQVHNKHTTRNRWRISTYALFQMLTSVTAMAAVIAPIHNKISTRCWQLIIPTSQQHQRLYRVTYIEFCWRCFLQQAVSLH